MERYRECAMPPLLPKHETTIDDQEQGSNSRKRSRDIDQMESLQKERLRREKTTQFFSILQSFVPNLLPKASKEAIVTNTIGYIRRLEEERERLEELKKVQSPPASSTPRLRLCSNRNFAVDVAFSDGMAFFEIESLARRSCLVTEIVGLFAANQAEVLAANVAFNGGHLRMTVTAAVSGGDGGVHTAEKIKTQILRL